MLNNNEYKGFFNALSRIYKEEGVLGMYRGYATYMLAVSYPKINSCNR